MSHNPANPAQAAALKEYYTMPKAERTGPINHTAPVSPTWRKWLDNHPSDNPHSIMIDTDSYKVSMWQQYPEGSTHVFSYIESRGGRFPNTVWFGLQAFVKRLENNPITADEVEFANGYWTAQGLPFNYGGWMYIVEQYDGRLPMDIKSIEEGSVVPIKNALLSAVNTDPNLQWLTTWIETPMLRVWYSTTVATLSWSIKQVISKFLDETATNEAIPAVLPFRLHDFGARGVSSYESAGIGGAAHLLNFMGTDTGAATLWAMKNYDAQIDPMTEAIPDTGIMVAPGYSIPASEHSTVTSWGRENEGDALENMLKKFGGPNKLVAFVSDSYDIWNMCENIMGVEKKELIEKMGGTLVVRPDSGDPTLVPIEVVERLGEAFGYTVNAKGYKVLPDYVRVLQGDGINLDSIVLILERLKEAGWSAENIAFGMGGALLQGPNRDTQNWAMKCSAICVNGVWRDVYKDPITDPVKTSKKGQLALVMEEGAGGAVYATQRAEDVSEGDNLLGSVFLDGSVTRFQTFDEIRERTNSWGKEIAAVMAEAA